MSIEKLTAYKVLADTDQVPVYSVDFGGDVRVPLAVLAQFLASLLPIPGAFETQYASPSSSGFTTFISPTTQGQSVYLVLTPAGAYAAGTIALPSAVDAADGQEVLCSCSQAVTSLTVSSSGATVVGAPATLAAGGFFRVRYDGVGLKWYRVG